MLDNIMLFIKLYETKSFKACAEKLNIKSATLSRYISSLEEELGNILLIRSSNYFKITEFGEHIYQHFKHLPNFVSRSIKSFNVQNQFDYSSGTLNVAIGSAIGYGLISENLYKFVEKYPNVRLNINFVNNLTTIPPNTDISLAAKYISGNNLVNRFIRNEKIKLYCKKEYAMQNGLPNRPEELDKHNIIGGLDNDNIPMDYTLFKNLKTKEEIYINSSNWKIKLNSPMHIKKVGMAANIIFASWDSLCSKEVYNGELINVLPEWYVFDIDYFIVTKNTTTKLEEDFIGFISECLSLSYNKIINEH